MCLSPGLCLGPHRGGGFQRPQLANVGSHHSRGPHRIAGPRAPRPHDPPLVLSNDFSRSPEASYNLFFLAIICRTMRMAQVVPFPGVKPNCISSTRTCDLILISSSLSAIFRGVPGRHSIPLVVYSRLNKRSSSPVVSPVSQSRPKCFICSL